jgi:hypothetical protein
MGSMLPYTAYMNPMGMGTWENHVILSGIYHFKPL